MPAEPATPRKLCLSADDLARPDLQSLLARLAVTDGRSYDDEGMLPVLILRIFGTTIIRFVYMPTLADVVTLAEGNMAHGPAAEQTQLFARWMNRMDAEPQLEHMRCTMCGADATACHDAFAMRLYKEGDFGEQDLIPNPAPHFVLCAHSYPVCSARSCRKKHTKRVQKNHAAH